MPPRKFTENIRRRDYKDNVAAHKARAIEVANRILAIAPNRRSDEEKDLLKLARGLRQLHDYMDGKLNG